MARQNESDAASPKHFWRIVPVGDSGVAAMISESSLVGASELYGKVRPRHGLVLARWNAEEQLGHVEALGIVKSVDSVALTAIVEWRSADIALRPSPPGRTYWANRPYFRFADDVAVRYMLADLFAEHFPEFREMPFGPAPVRIAVSRPSSTVAVAGYVYVIRSQYGFKIGKTINLKARTRLFEVKLPFPISLEHCAWFDDYTAAERQFHRQFHHLRLEGEWFALGAAELAEIKKHGNAVQA